MKTRRDSAWTLVLTKANDFFEFIGGQSTVIQHKAVIEISLQLGLLQENLKSSEGRHEGDFGVIDSDRETAYDSIPGTFEHIAGDPGDAGLISESDILTTVESVTMEYAEDDDNEDLPLPSSCEDEVAPEIPKDSITDRITDVAPIESPIPKRKRGRPKKKIDNEDNLKTSETRNDIGPKIKRLKTKRNPEWGKKRAITPGVSKPLGRPRKQFKSLDVDLEPAKGETHPCSTCGKLLHSRSAIEDHMRSHTGELITCSDCDKQFLSRYKYYQHKRKEHGRKAYFNCDKCAYSTLQQSLLDDHYKNKHDPSRAKFVCDYCGKSYINSSSLKDHMFVHKDGRYACPTCDHVTHSPQLLKMHQRNVHSDEHKRSFDCKLCNASMTTKGSLHAHMRGHFDHKPYKCDVCGAKFGRSSGLSCHKKIHADPEFACEECGKKFINSYKLNVHKVVHSGEKSFKCDFCEYRCNLRHNLTKHCKNVHKVTLPQLKKGIKKLIDGSQLENVDSVVIVSEGKEESTEVLRLGTPQTNEDEQVVRNDLTVRVSLSAPIESMEEQVTNDGCEDIHVKDSSAAETVSQIPDLHTHAEPGEMITLPVPGSEVKPPVIPVVVEETQ